MSDIIEYEQEDLLRAREIIELGFLMDSDRKTLQSTEENIKDVAKKYYQLRLLTFNPDTGRHY
jgi:hypothetical protein